MGGMGADERVMGRPAFGKLPVYPVCFEQGEWAP
jgi:hypothetical protein